MQNFKLWMRLSTAGEKTRLATLAKTSLSYLYVIAAGDNKPSAEMAARIENATAKMVVSSKYRLPWVMRTDICAACSKCPHVVKCGTKS